MAFDPAHPCCNNCKHSRASGWSVICYSKKMDKLAAIRPDGDRIARKIVDHRFDKCAAWEKGEPALKISKGIEIE